MDIQHTRFAVLFNYLKELYVLAEGTRNDQLKQMKAKFPEFEEITHVFEKEERFAHPDELKKRNLTDFKRRVHVERARKIQLMLGDETKRGRPTANVSLIQLLQDQIAEMRTRSNHQLDGVNEEQQFEDDYFAQTRQGLQESIMNRYNDKDESDPFENVPFYLRDSYKHSNQLLKKIVHLDLKFKSQLETSKAEHRIRNN